MLIKSLLLALYAGLAEIDGNNTQLKIGRPLVAGPIVGLILGDVEKGLIVGTVLEMVGLGMIGLGGVSPPNIVIGGILGTAFAITTGVTPKVAVCLAIPFAMLAQLLIVKIYKNCCWFARKIDEYVEKGNIRGIELVHLSGIIPLFIFSGGIVFLTFYFGANMVEKLVKLLPPVIIGGLEVAGGMMPAVGFAMLLKVMLRKEYFPLLLLGFVLIAYFKLPLTAVIIMALIIAVYTYFKRSLNKGDGGAINNGI
ncbi:MAG TPA: PTS sugar transporter subunit IIC [Clostridia bacterium]|nr:PTS sugar transporter subunit IIC [Clostridia bacterium]